jgi:hypothetical protein
MCNHKAKAELYGLSTNMYDSNDERYPELKYKNPAIIPPLQSCETLAKILQIARIQQSVYALPQ